MSAGLARCGKLVGLHELYPNCNRCTKTDPVGSEQPGPNLSKATDRHKTGERGRRWWESAFRTTAGSAMSHGYGAPALPAVVVFDAACRDGARIQVLSRRHSCHVLHNILSKLGALLRRINFRRWWCWHNLALVSLFNLAKALRERVNSWRSLCSVLLQLANFFYERVSLGCCHSGSSHSRSGVTIAGGTSPSLVQRILRWSTFRGFAGCRTFQLSRYSMLWTQHAATCSASPLTGPGMSL